MKCSTAILLCTTLVVLPAEVVVEAPQRVEKIQEVRWCDDPKRLVHWQAYRIDGVTEVVNPKEEALWSFWQLTGDKPQDRGGY